MDNLLNLLSPSNDKLFKTFEILIFQNTFLIQVSDPFKNCFVLPPDNMNDLNNNTISATDDDEGAFMELLEQWMNDDMALSSLWRYPRPHPSRCHRPTAQDGRERYNKWGNILLNSLKTE